MIALFLLLVIAAIVLGIVGVAAKGLLYLLIIGIAVFLVALILAALRMRRRPGRRPAWQASGPVASSLSAQHRAENAARPSMILLTCSGKARNSCSCHSACEVLTAGAADYQSPAFDYRRSR